MKLQRLNLLGYLVSAAVILAAAAPLRAAPVSIWRTFKAAPATVIDSGQGTAGPVFGNTTTTSSASRLIGYFTPQTLANVGDKISLTFNVSFNDAAGMGNSGDNFRFALFDRNGEAVPATDNVASNGSTDTNGFLGYWAGVMTGSGTDGSLRRRTDVTNNDMFANASASANLATIPITGTDVPLTGLVNGVGTETLYAGEFTLTRTATGVDLSGGFSGNGGANAFAYSDATPASLTYSAVGFLNAGGISADQVIFRNVDVTYTAAVPEPTAAALLATASSVGLAIRRRRGTR